YSIYTVKRSSQNRRIRRRRYNLILAESKFKNLVLDRQDKYMMKAQVHVSKSSEISDEQALPQRKHYCQIYQMINFTCGVKWPRAINIARPRPVNTARQRPINTTRPNSVVVNVVRGHPQNEDQGYAESGCSRHVTGNMSYLSDFKEFDGGHVTFGGGAKKEELLVKEHLKLIENLVDKKVKVIICDNRTEFKNCVVNDFCAMKGIRREFSVAKSPQQNGFAKRRNRTLIEATRTMLADFKLPTTFWAEAVSTAYYVQNRALVVKPYNMTPYELFRVRTPALSFMRPFACHVTILNTLDHLDKFDGKTDEGYFVRYFIHSKAFRISGDARKKHDEVSDKEIGALNKLNSAFENLNTEYPDDPKMLGLETIATYDDSEEDADSTNLESSIHVNPTPTTRTHKNHPCGYPNLIDLFSLLKLSHLR
nr:ribonuclease H-like domain-containing protein [Tanacetum cinerariifolium]